MKFMNEVKGRFAEQLVRTLLVDAGYQVIPFGIENIVREVATLSVSDYKAQAFATPLRKLPDFLVLDPDPKQAKWWHVEVKYRNEWNDEVRDELLNTVKEQLKVWEPLTLVVLLGTPTRKYGKFVYGEHKPVYSMGSVTLYRDENLDPVVRWETEDGMKDYLFSKAEWGTFNRLHDTDAFPRLKEESSGSTLTQAVKVLKAISQLR